MTSRVSPHCLSAIQRRDYIGKDQWRLRMGNEKLDVKINLFDVRTYVCCSST